MLTNINPLILAINENDIDFITFLINRGANPNKAVEKSDLKLVKLLIDKGAKTTNENRVFILHLFIDSVLL